MIGRNTGAVTIKGVDRFIHIEDVSKLSSRTIPIRAEVIPDNMSRLKTIASAYQRIRYLHLSFRVESQISTATSGGYVASFIRDATEELPDGEKGLATLTSSQGSKTTKWWQSTTVNVGVLPDLYYTSNSTFEERWSSPGIFCLGVDGKASQVGSLTVFIRYTVQMCEPSFEQTTMKPVLLCPENLLIVKDNYHLKNKAGEVDATKLLSGSTIGRVYKLPTIRSYMTTEGALWTFNCILHDSSNHLVVANESGAPSEAKSNADQLGIMAGEVLKILKQGGAKVQLSQYLCAVSSGQSLEEQLQDFQLL